MGNWTQGFWGGREVRALEEEWAQKFGVRHAIACNSATSGLFIACGAVGMGHGKWQQDVKDVRREDAIVSPFSMTCSATAPMGWGEAVHFADVERDHYCISADSVRALLTRMFSKTYSAILPVSLFGQPYDAQAINRLAREHNTYVIEDAAQAVGATLEYEYYTNEAVNKTPTKHKVKKYAGTLGDIGVYSFNLGKHLTCGEGGMIVTDNDELAMRCRLIMNHAEAVVNDASYKKDAGPDGVFVATIGLHLFGFNLRLPEISAAIVREQLRKMDDLIGRRVDNVAYLVDKLRGIPCLEMPAVREGATHSYYVLPLKYKYDVFHHHADPGYEGGVAERIHRDKFVAAVKAELQPVKDRESEGVTIGAGYVRPIQSMPLFGRSLDETPECRRQWQDELIIVHRMFGPLASRKDLDDIAAAFAKVWENREEII